jgi:hypothetical protein
MEWGIFMLYKNNVIEGISEETDRTVGLYQPLDGITNPKYNLLHFLTTIFCK